MSIVTRLGFEPRTRLDFLGKAFHHPNDSEDELIQKEIETREGANDDWHSDWYGSRDDDGSPVDESGRWLECIDGKWVVGNICR